jgi:hypothetical protein
MNHLRLLIVALVTVSSGMALAQKNKRTTPTTDPASSHAAESTGGYQAPSSPAPTLLAVQPPPPNPHVYPGLHARLKLGPSFTSSRLSSDGGVNATLPQTMATYYGGEIHYRNQNYEKLKIVFKYDNNYVRFKDLSVTRGPGNTAVLQEHYNLGLRAYPLSGSRFLDNLYVGVGYFFDHKDVDVTDPMYADGWDTHGTEILFGYSDQLTSKIFYEVDTAIMFVNYIRENTARTGFYNHGYYFDGSFKVVLPYTDLLDFAVGVVVRSYNHSFEGSAGTQNASRARGSNDASDRSLVTAIPFELRLRF